MQRRTLTAAALFALLPALPVVAQNASLGGRWVLSVEKSFLAKEHPPTDYRLTRTIRLESGRIEVADTSAHAARMNISFPDGTATQDLLPDGKGHAAQKPGFFPGMPPESIQITTVWQGNTLVVDEQGASVVHRRLYLAAPNVLVELVESHDTFGDSEQRLVFDRRE